MLIQKVEPEEAVIFAGSRCAWSSRSTADCEAWREYARVRRSAEHQRNPENGWRRFAHFS